jgi:nitroimidazol reductase NimA-like FMN-containing flavoprotein (pyridoxamine 5'-phosphate oxidase superfamily)
MSTETLAAIARLMDRCRDMTLATARPDGSPAADTVSFARDGLTLYVATRRGSHKVRNLHSRDKVAATMRADYDGWSTVQGLSIIGTAQVLADDDPEAAIAHECLARRFRHERSSPSPQDLPDSVYLAIRPTEITLVDYTKGYGHRDVVRIPDRH